LNTAAVGVNSIAFLGRNRSKYVKITALRAVTPENDYLLSPQPSYVSKPLSKCIGGLIGEA